MNITDFTNKKHRGEKITMTTCYDYTSARMLSQSNIDCLLMGDSVAMVMHGFKDTLSATVDMMQLHTEAVARGAGQKFIITDLPFLSFRKSISKTVTAAEKLVRAGASALKIEGAQGNIKIIRYLIESGIPIMGHLGFIMQYKNITGHHIVQGKTDESKKRIQEDAHQLEEAGCFAIVLECMPALLAKSISQSLTIPTIGIGAGGGTDGQVLVLQDLLGLNIDFKPKFVKYFANGYEQFKTGVHAFVEEVQQEAFPNHEHCY